MKFFANLTGYPNVFCGSDFLCFNSNNYLVSFPNIYQGNLSLGNPNQRRGEAISLIDSRSFSIIFEKVPIFYVWVIKRRETI